MLQFQILAQLLGLGSLSRFVQLQTTYRIGLFGS